MQLLMHGSYCCVALLLPAAAGAVQGVALSFLELTTNRIAPLLSERRVTLYSGSAFTEVGLRWLSPLQLRAVLLLHESCMSSVGGLQDRV
jgi:hypothetical protein